MVGSILRPGLGAVEAGVVASVAAHLAEVLSAEVGHLVVAVQVEAGKG
jgi:hypothetical protein